MGSQIALFSMRRFSPLGWERHETVTGPGAPICSRASCHIWPMPSTATFGRASADSICRLQTARAGQHGIPVPGGLAACVPGQPGTTARRADTGAGHPNGPSSRCASRSW